MATAKSRYRILTSYYRPKPGGFCKRYFRAINALLVAGYDVHYLALERFPIDHPRCHFHQFPWPSGRADSLLFWGIFHLLSPILLVYLAARHRVSHAFAFGATYAALLQPARLLLRIPLTLFLRGDVLRAHELKNRSRWVRVIDSMIEGVGLVGVDVYGVSAALLHKVLGRHRFFRPASADILRNDLPDSYISAPPSERVILNVACVGILESTKNQQFAVALWAQLPRNTLHLRLYGTGPAEPGLRKLAKELGVSDEVHFMGWTDPRDIWPNVDVLLMPSLHEGAPNAVLEAIACGVPVLASAIPEHYELLPDCAVLPLVPLDWTKRLSDLAKNPAVERAWRVDAQLAHAASLRFDWDEHIVRLVTQ